MQHLRLSPLPLFFSSLSFFFFGLRLELNKTKEQEQEHRGVLQKNSNIQGRERGKEHAILLLSQSKE
jgi:hypothetical protein